MASKSTILRATSFEDFASLFRFLRSPGMRPLLSLGQVETLADVIDANLPADVALEQRTPKGTVYITLDGDDYGTVNQAGRYLAPSGSGQFLTRKDLRKKALTSVR